MPKKSQPRIKRNGAVRLGLLLALALAPLFASEHHGAVKFGGVPVPGATVTATQGDKKFVAVTDEQGEYRFAELADGVWNIHVDMLCFEPFAQDVAVATDAEADVAGRHQDRGGEYQFGDRGVGGESGSGNRNRHSGIFHAGGESVAERVGGSRQCQGSSRCAQGKAR
jgi:hypothetical protein